MAQMINKPFCIAKRENISSYFIIFFLHKDSYNFYGIDLILHFFNTVKQNFNPTTETSIFFASFEYVSLNDGGLIRSYNFKISKIFNGQYFNDFIIGKIFNDIALNVLQFAETIIVWRFNSISLVIIQNYFFFRKNG